MDRALHGVEVPVYSYGKLVGSRTVYNDRLVMFMLRNRAPDRFTGGKAKAMNAADKETLRKLKIQWREEWERDRVIREDKDEHRAYAEIDDMLDRMIASERVNRALLLEDARETEDEADERETPA